jgi:hypothetical protein
MGAYGLLVLPTAQVLGMNFSLAWTLELCTSPYCPCKLGGKTNLEHIGEEMSRQSGYSSDVDLKQPARDVSRVVVKVFLYITSCAMLGISLGLIGPAIAEAVSSEGDDLAQYRQARLAEYYGIMVAVLVPTSILAMVSVVRASWYNIITWLGVHWALFSFDLVLFLLLLFPMGEYTRHQIGAGGIMLVVYIVIHLIYVILLTMLSTFRFLAAKCC